MRIFTQFELNQFEAYHVLKTILNEAEIQIFFNTPQADRGTKIPNKRVVKVAPQVTEVATIEPPLKKWELRRVDPPTMVKEKVGTQMCTVVDIDSVRDMALDYIERTWTYRGRDFKMTDMGWKFRFNDRKQANGICSPHNRTIYLSSYIIEHSTREMSGWINTMVHEIAHAINHHIGGRGHDWQWRDIFVTFGGTGERCSNDVKYEGLLEKPISKYTTVCPNGHLRPSYKRSRKIEQGQQSCGECRNRFDTRYLLKQIQNW